MAAMKRTVLALMLFASLAAAQVTVPSGTPAVVAPPVTVTGSPPAINPPKPPKSPKSPSATTVVPTAATPEGPIPPDYLNVPTDTTTGTATDTTFKPDGNNTADPALTGCRNQYHTLVASGDECNSKCNGKVERAKDPATVAPEVYPSELGGTCCNCNFKRTTDGALAPDSGEGTLTPDFNPPSPTTPPGVLDPTTFKPPTTSELVIAVDPTYVQTPEPGEVNTYAVLRVTGTTFTTPLSFDNILGFIYAFNNVTGVPFQYKGDAPAIPDQYPAAPNGLPQVKNGAPPASPTPSLAPAPAAVAPPTVAPVVEPAAAAATAVPAVDPATGAPIVPAPVRRLLRSSSHRLSSSQKSHRHLLQDYGATPGAYDFSPTPGTEDYGTSGSDYGNDYNSPSNDYGNSPDPYSSPSPPANDYNDYNNNDSGNDYNSPSPDAGYVASPDAYSSPPSPDTAYGESPETTYEPPPVLSPPPAPEIVFTAPPAPPGVPLPADADGIWYFAMEPLSDSKFRAIGAALTAAVADPNSKFYTSLTASGVPANGVELRYYGQATDGQIDLTKKLEGDLFGAASYAPPPADESSMSTATIGAIVGGVVGGCVIIAIAGVLVASNRRKSTKAQKQALTQRWKTERELVENERVKIEAENSGAYYVNGSAKQTRSQNSAHDAGFVVMTSNDLEQQRSMRRAATMAAEAKLSSKQLGIEASPSLSARSGAGTPKPSRLDSMRAALGLNKTSSSIKKGTSAATATAATTPSSAPRSGSFAWTVEGGTGVSPLNPTRSLRSQFSTGGPAAAAPSPSRSGGDIEAPSTGDKPSPFGRMFSKK